MTRGLPTGVPCGVCLARVVGWHDPADDDEWAAQPCGHTEREILAIGMTMTEKRVSALPIHPEPARSAP